MVKKTKFLNSYLIKQFLSIDAAERGAFLEGLKPETREYLFVILEKAEKDPQRLKRFLDLE